MKTENENDNIFEAKGNLREISDAINHGKIHLEEVGKKIKTAEDDFSVLSGKLDADIGQRKSDLESVTLELNAKSESFDSDVKALEKSRDERKAAVQREIDSMNTEFANRAKEHEENVEILNSEFSSKKDAVAVQIKDAEEQLANLISDFDTLSRDKKLKETEMNAMIEEKKTLEIQLSGLHSDLLEIGTQIEAKKNDHAAETVKHSDLVATNESIISEISTKESRMSELTDAIPKLEARHAEITAAIDRDTPAHQAYIAERTSFSAQVGALKQKEVDIRNKYKELGLNYE